jgi:hypothetical protein
MPYQLPDIPFLKLRFRFTSEGDCTLPLFKGSMLRGAFGHALKKTVCVMGSGQPCNSCLLRPQCAYTRIFETFTEEEPPRPLKGLKTSPRPFVIDDFEPQRTFRKGDSFKLDLTLFGRACEMYPYVIFAFLRAGEQGFGVRRHRFELRETLWFDKAWIPLYDGEKKSLVQMATTQTIQPNGGLSSPLMLRFLTPTRIKTDSKLTMELSFRQLAVKMITRVLEIAHFHAPGSIVDWNFKDLIEASKDVRIVESKLFWEDVKRYSNRQNTKMSMGGFWGEMVLEGELEPFEKLFRTCEVLHVGKGTVFGLGKMRVG